MTDLVPWLRMTELDEISSLELADRIEQFGGQSIPKEPRRYPGYPEFPLPKTRSRWLTRLDKTLFARRCVQELGTQFPEPARLSHLLWHSHGISAGNYRGPTPSAGGLQAIELYLVHWQQAWLPIGAYHYDRRAHALVQLTDQANADAWKRLIPSSHTLQGGCLLWLIAGDSQRMSLKYGDRTDRFLLLEAGHLMQNICLVSHSLQMTTVPLGGVLEGRIREKIKLPSSDCILYAGLCG